MSLKENTEFNVLGYKVKFNSENEGEVAASRIVSLVLEEAEAIRAKAPNLENGQIAILTALKIASEKIASEDDYKKTVNEIQSNALHALNLIEEVSPTTI